MIKKLQNIKSTNIKSVFLYICDEFTSLHILQNLIKFPKIKKLTFGDDYEHALYPGYLPNTLKKLTFGSLYNEKIKQNVLPGSLTKLTFGHDFDQKIEPKVFPEFLIKLTFGMTSIKK